MLRDMQPCQLTLRDGRQLGYRLMGAPLGESSAALYFHGHPTSSREGELWQEAVPDGVALICFDRPGSGRCYVEASRSRTVLHWRAGHLVSLHQCVPAGGSSFDCRSSLESVAADAAELLDHLHIPAAVAMGMSGLCTGPVCVLAQGNAKLCDAAGAAAGLTTHLPFCAGACRRRTIRCGLCSPLS